MRNITDLDETTGSGAQGYTLTRVVRVDGFTVQVRVQRDSYERQSYAVADVLAGDLTWTRLAEEHPCNWHGATSYKAVGTVQVYDQLGPVADRLIRRAAEILPPAGA